MKRKRVEDLMSRSVISLKETDSIQVAKLEMDIASIRHIPVVDANQHVVGIVAIADVLQALSRGVRHPIPVREVMQREVVTIHRRALAHDAARTMLDRKIGALPVLGDHERLEGMITDSDFLRVAEQALHP